MSRPKGTKSTKSNVIPMENQNDSAVATAEPEPATPFDAAPAATPPKPAPQPSTQKRLTFFQRAAAVPKADWGTRVFIYVYCLEPICNLKMGGESKYLVRLSEPITDEQSLMVDYGSGKYRLQMVNRNPGEHEGKATDLTEIEIYNPKYPPKIPRSVWINDPRNERWAALLPKEEAPSAPTPLGTVTDAFNTFTAMQRSIREELTPPPVPPAPPGPPPSDPMQNALSMVQTIMAMKADNPMVEIMKEQLKAQNEANEKAREREAALQKELRDNMRQAAAPVAKTGIKETLAELKEFLPAIKELLPGAGEALSNMRSPRTNWLDIVRDIAPGAVSMLGQLAVAMAQRPQPGPTPPYPTNANPAARIQAPGTPPPAAPSLTDQRIMTFLTQNATPMMNYFQGFIEDPPRTLPGDFAQWVYDGHGEAPLKDARSMGSERIMALFKSSPGWPAMAAHEAKLTEFVDGVLGWQPEAEEEDEDNEGVDLSATM